MNDNWLGQRISACRLAGSGLNSDKISWEVPIPYKTALSNSTTLSVKKLNWSGTYKYKSSGSLLTELTENIPLSTADLDLNGFVAPLWGCSAKNLLTQEQQEYIKTKNYEALGYNIYDEPRKRIRTIEYTSAKTIGYYRLRDAIARTTDPTNVYLFVMEL